MGDFGVAIHPLKAKALLYGGRALRILRYNPYILTVEELYDGEFGYVMSVPPALQMLLDMHSLQTRDVLPDVYTDVVAIEEEADDGDTLIHNSPSGIIRRKVTSYKHCDNFRWMTVPGGRQIHQGPKTFISIGIHSGVEVFYGLPHPQIALVHLHIDHSGYPKFLQFGGQVIKELIHLVKHKADEGFNGFVRSEGDARLCNRVVPADTPPLHNLTDFNCDRIPELQDKISLYLDAWWATPGHEMRWTKSRQIGLCNIPQGFEFLLHNHRSNLSLSDLGFIVHNWGFVNTVGVIRKPTLKGDRYIFPMHPLLEFFYRFYIGFKPAFLGPYESFDHRSSPAVSHIYDVIKFDKRFFPYFAAWASSRGLFFLIPAVDMWIRRKHLFGWPHEIPSGIIPTSEICKTMTAAFADYVGCTEAIIGGDSIGCNREIKFFKHKCCEFYDDTNWVKLSEDFNGFKHYDGQWRFSRWGDGLCKQRYIRPGGINGEGLWHLRRWCYERMGATDMPIKDEQIGKFIPNKIFREAEVDEVMGFVEKFNTKPNCWRKYMCGNPKKSNYDLIPNRCFGFYHKSGSVDRVQIPLISNLLPPRAF